jgi:uncharacterized membrane protein YgaE (UPF0421/DUF939 family)
MRNIKTALAVFICILIANIFSLESPFYTAIAAIVTMQNSVKGSFKAGKNRILGTFIGAIIGYLCAIIAPGNTILCALGIVAVIYICNLFKWNEAAAMGGIVFCAIMLNLGSKSPLFYSFNRLLDTLVGIIVALTINYFIAPPEE